MVWSIYELGIFNINEIFYISSHTVLPILREAMHFQWKTQIENVIFLWIRTDFKNT